MINTSCKHTRTFNIVKPGGDQDKNGGKVTPKANM